VGEAGVDIVYRTGPGDTCKQDMISLFSYLPAVLLFGRL